MTTERLTNEEWNALYENDAVDYLRADRHALLDALAQREREVERLRGLLRRMEWAGQSSGPMSTGSPHCLICNAEKGYQDHKPDCALAAATKEPPHAV